ncbi:hypothetical protein JTB14_000613 [Gonioctena quinquepunctata]|nr:hypothetical protein JTB14_000613 [Gonioctena quinquepunctata]
MICTENEGQITLLELLIPGDIMYTSKKTHPKEAKQNNQKAHINGNKLFVESKSYTIQDLELGRMEIAENGTNIGPTNTKIRATAKPISEEESEADEIHETNKNKKRKILPRTGRSTTQYPK